MDVENVGTQQPSINLKNQYNNVGFIKPYAYMLHVRI